MNKLRGRPLTEEEQALNFVEWLTHCDECENEIHPSVRICPHCGYDLHGDEDK